MASLVDDTAVIEVTVSMLLFLLDTDKQEKFHFVIRVWHTHAGLSLDEVLVAVKDISLLVPDSCEYNAIVRGTVVCQYHSISAFIQPVEEVAPHLLTLVTHCSLDRLPRLEEQVLAYGNAPISVALLVPFFAPPSTEKEEVINRIRRFHKDLVAKGAHRVAISLLFANPPSEREYDNLYPSNALRNLALDVAKTEMVFLVDVDSVPSRDLALFSASSDYDNYRKLCMGGAVLVVASFEVQCEHNVAVDMPKTQEELYRLYRQQRVEGFQTSTFPAGHGPTNFSRWFGEKVPYIVQYENMFEPYIIAWKEGIPAYDERFRGVCFDKISHLYEVAAKMNFIDADFIVLPSVFLVARTHGRSFSWERQLGNDRDPQHAVRIDLLWADFKHKVQATYASRKSNNVERLSNERHSAFLIETGMEVSTDSISVDFDYPALVYRRDESGLVVSMELNLQIQGYVPGFEFVVLVEELGLASIDFDMVKRTWKKEVSAADLLPASKFKAVFSEPERNQQHRFMVRLLEKQSEIPQAYDQLKLKALEGIFAAAIMPERTTEHNVCTDEEWVIFVSVSFGYDDMFRNWLYWFRQLNLPNRLIIITEDKKIYNMYKQLGLFGVWKGSWQNFSHAVNYASQNFKRLVSSRASYLKNVLAQSNCVIYSDIDTVWLKTPIPFFTGDHDLWISYDSPGSFCTGLMALKNTTRSRDLVNKWVEILRLPQKKLCNQGPFNDMVKRVEGLSINVLDPNLFPPGRVYFSHEQPEGTVVLHNNWIVGRRKKILRFKKIGLWVENVKLQHLLNADKGLRIGSAGHVQGSIFYSSNISDVRTISVPATKTRLLPTPTGSNTEDNIKQTHCASDHNLHGDSHPFLIIEIGSMPLVYRGNVGEMELTFGLNGAVPGFEYRIVVQELDLAARVRQQKDMVLSINDDSREEIMVILPRIDENQGHFLFAIEIWDVYEGLSSVEAIIARKELESLLLANATTSCGVCKYQDLVSVLLSDELQTTEKQDKRRQASSSGANAGASRRRVCQEEVLVKSVTSQGDTSMKNNVTLATVSNLHQCLISLYTISNWGGPVSIVYHAQSLDERVAIAAFVAETLAPLCRRRRQDLSAKMLSDCSRSSNLSQSIPMNTLRWTAVASAVTPLVFYVDGDVVTSTGALHSIIKYYFDSKTALDSFNLLVLPCFWTMSNSTWPWSLQLLRDSEGWPSMELEYMSKDRLLVEMANNRVTFERLKTSSESVVDGVVAERHKPSNYSFWIRQAAYAAPYETEYALWYEPYLVINTTSWKGEHGSGLFNQNFDHFPDYGRRQMSLEAATLGYAFMVQPGEYVVHVPKTWQGLPCDSSVIPIKFCQALEREKQRQRAKQEQDQKKRTNEEGGNISLPSLSTFAPLTVPSVKQRHGFEVMVRRNEIWVADGSNLVECCKISGSRRNTSFSSPDKTLEHEVLRQNLSQTGIGKILNYSVQQAPSPSSLASKCRDHFVSGYFDMGLWRKTRQDYIDKMSRMALFLTRAGCTFTFYCLGHKYEKSNYNCSDFASQIPSNITLFRIQQYALNDAMLDLWGIGMEQTRRQFRKVLENMSQNPQLGNTSNSDLLKRPLDIMQWYVMINHAKFSILRHASREIEGSCSSGACLVWVDAGLLAKDLDAGHGEFIYEFVGGCNQACQCVCVCVQ